MPRISNGQARTACADWIFISISKVSMGLGVAALAAAATASGARADEVPAVLAALTTPQSLPHSTADHAKFKELQGPFASGPEVTAACLSCHTEAGDQVMHSLHWTWDYTHPVTGQELGKANVINAFCGNVASNETRCTSCHAGYGWTDVRQSPPPDATRVDCLACHDNSGQYAKQDNLAGHPPLDPVAPGAKTITGALATAVDLGLAARSVGMPTRENCGSCHFYGGGGDNVKHGDLSSVLYHPSVDVDVHMSADGANFTCQSCHETMDHQVAGSRYHTDVDDRGADRAPGAARGTASCVSCHGERPHPQTSVVGVKLNDHTDRVACESCHIPSFARGGVATKTWWDWSEAGRLDANGKPIHEDGYVQGDGRHLHTYLSTKGVFRWGENVVPYYTWFDGDMTFTLAEDQIDPTAVVSINTPQGSATDPQSRIFPFKRMQGKQVYDAGLNRLAMSHVYGPTTDTAFWTNFDWDKSVPVAMAYAGQEFSGQIGFVETEMFWPIAHQVAPAKDAVQCEECHATGGGRMASVPGVYLPGKGPGPAGWIGMVLVALAAMAVIGHSILRLFGKGGGHHDDDDDDAPCATFFGGPKNG
ncbi:tetrathionate reductase family octaheme c-type cytochrome [Phaeovulum vinaykumarii]|uniref:Octaheme c-type cytochrome, tetrathionate reductase family n=1 Tax=Phaeovulum vinaykumarii TaxID=407234 RepID=A0A1N7JT83_9RHOB|nr:tetrathionate reductase family octaheme c-type cytochrome [Phaeovulum vinaykumarii]SIS52471.1 octaheme c-type cytochrome, tetrathionate reductase family [Phaeovulum vinaykumarii]SOB91234.1 octaheme c-type cytochrome (tetrathionate reductase family) [Phaeovulum vinaykumarii]